MKNWIRKRHDQGLQALLRTSEPPRHWASHVSSGFDFASLDAVSDYLKDQAARSVALPGDVLRAASREFDREVASVKASGPHVGTFLGMQTMEDVQNFLAEKKPEVDAATALVASVVPAWRRVDLTGAVNFQRDWTTFHQRWTKALANASNLRVAQGAYGILPPGYTPTVGSQMTVLLRALNPIPGVVGTTDFDALQTRLEQARIYLAQPGVLPGEQQWQQRNQELVTPGTRAPRPNAPTQPVPMPGVSVPPVPNWNLLYASEMERRASEAHAKADEESKKPSSGLPSWEDAKPYVIGGAALVGLGIVANIAKSFRS